MEPFVRTLAHASGWILLVLIPIVLVQAALIVHLLRKMGDHLRRWKRIAGDSVAMDLDTILSEAGRERAELVALFEGSQGRLARMENEIAELRGRTGFVRYDAFAEVRGENSFSLAVLDARGDGVVLTSIVGREEGRVYCKGIVEGRPDRALSDEERRAIDSARSGNAPNGDAQADHRGAGHRSARASSVR